MHSGNLKTKHWLEIISIKSAGVYYAFNIPYFWQSWYLKTGNTRHICENVIAFNDVINKQCYDNVFTQKL